MSYATAADAASKGNAAVGQALFEKRCQRCHTIKRLAGLGDLIRRDMRRINTQMSVLGLLWDEEVADLRAYINSVPRPKSEK
jgi:mono/diheme cytochrome c family protein